MPTVAITRSSERHLTFERVLAQVRETLEHLGGMEAFVAPNESVLILPDDTGSCASETACRTDPRVVEALVHLARMAGAGKIDVAGSGEGRIDFDSDEIERREVAVPEGRVLGRVTLPVALPDADVLIFAPKAKTDPFDSIAGAMKLACSMVSREWRAEHEGHGDPVERFADILTVVRPSLCVTDALICGEGDGPRGNVPHWCGCILASIDPVAMDVTIAKLLGLEPGKLRFAAAGEVRGIGSHEPIVWLGSSVERVAFQAWPSHADFGNLPLNVLVGSGVSRDGTGGELRDALEMLLRRGEIESVIARGETPTVMIGDCEDPEFERHVEQGPYVVIDDAARMKYKSDRRVHFIGGHPILRDVTEELRRAFGVRTEARPVKSEAGSARRSNRAAVAAIAIGAVVAVAAFVKRALS
jgi:uncharacterized protein (DUF362 family)